MRKNNKVIGKEWRVETTNGTFASKAHIPRLKQACQGEHAVCEGSLTRKSAFYPKKMARHVIHHMSQPHVQSNNDLGSSFRKSYSNSKCCCKLFRDGSITQLRPWCHAGNHWLKMGNPNHKAFAGEEEPEENPEEVWKDGERNEWEKSFDWSIVPPVTGVRRVWSIPSKKKESPKKFWIWPKIFGVVSVKNVKDLIPGELPPWKSSQRDWRLFWRILWSGIIPTTKRKLSLVCSWTKVVGFW